MATRNRAPRRKFIPIGEAAEMIGVDKSTIRRYIREGDLRAYKTPGGHTRIDARDAEDLLRRVRPEEVSG